MLRLQSPMADLPKIVMQRLQQKKVAAGGHPDSNLISAFAENSLPSDARLQVVQHLAQCADCREVVFLVSPDQVATLSAVATDQSRWLSWPVLRWGAAVAAIVVVVAAVTLHRPSGGRSISSGAVQMTDIPVAKAKAPSATTPLEEKLPVATRTSPVSPVAKNDSVTNVEGNRLDELKKQSSRVAPSPMLAQKSNALGGKVTSADRDEFAETQTVEVGAQAQAPVETATVEARQLVPGRAKDAAAEPASGVGGGTGAGFAPGAATASQSRAAIYLPMAAPRWTLTSEGTLQRSLDFGRTWQTVQLASQVSFRALAASGKDIWVGGSKGALYHSSDAGQHWRQVQPIAAGQALTDDIIGVEFPDAIRGKLTTSGQETWTTEDGGQTWRKP